MAGSRLVPVLAGWNGAVVGRRESPPFGGRGRRWWPDYHSCCWSLCRRSDLETLPLRTASCGFQDARHRGRRWVSSSRKQNSLFHRVFRRVPLLLAVSLVSDPSLFSHSGCHPRHLALCYVLVSAFLALGLSLEGRFPLTSGAAAVPLGFAS